MNEILQTVFLSNLLDIYAPLLTEKQATLMDLHINQDLSLAEIAEQTGTSRQAIHDALKRGEKTLRSLEQQLHVFQEQKTKQRVIPRIISTIQQWSLDDQEQHEREQVITLLHSIMETEGEADGI